MNQDDTKPEVSSGVTGAPTPPTKARLLIVDDDKFLLNMYGMKFSSAGYTVQTCFSGKEALEMIRGGFLPEVIIFDITMPELDGFAFLKTLADEHLVTGAIKIALTNQSDEAEKTKATELGADHYIVKASMIPSEVVNTVAEVLAKHHA